MPTNGDAPTVAPAIVQVKVVTVQLSEVTGLDVPKVASHKPNAADVFILAGQAIVGSSISVTVTFWLQAAILPEPSVTVHVTTVTPIGNSTGALLVTLATIQLSAVTGTPNTTPLAVHKPASVFTATFAGHTIVGSSISVTVTFWLQVAVLPLKSVTVQVTTVMPIGYTAGPLLVTEATPQLSAVTGTPKATPLAVQMPASVFTATFAGQVIVGF